jgi:Protein of unknown function (DUF3619)
MQKTNPLLAKKICARLDEGIEIFDPKIEQALNRARLRALNNKNDAPHSRTSLWIRGFEQWLMPSGRWVLPAMLLMGTLGFLGYQSYQEQEDMEVDVALLTSDLPLEAYTDQGFDQWIRKQKLERGQACHNNAC